MSSRRQYHSERGRIARPSASRSSTRWRTPVTRALPLKRAPTPAISTTSMGLTLVLPGMATRPRIIDNRLRASLGVGPGLQLLRVQRAATASRQVSAPILAATFATSSPTMFPCSSGSVFAVDGWVAFWFFWSQATLTTFSGWRRRPA